MTQSSNFPKLELVSSTSKEWSYKLDKTKEIKKMLNRHTKQIKVTTMQWWEDIITPQSSTRQLKTWRTGQSHPCSIVTNLIEALSTCPMFLLTDPWIENSFWKQTTPDSKELQVCHLLTIGSAFKIVRCTQTASMATTTKRCGRVWIDNRSMRVRAEMVTN